MGHFEPENFEDRYEDALKELLRKKQHGEKIERPKEHAPSNVVNLMDALRKSVEAERGAEKRKIADKGTASHRPTKKATRSGARKRAS